VTVYQIEFHKAAERELNDTVSFYDELELGLGDRFLDDVDIGLAHIVRNPSAWPIQKEPVRKKVLGTFPYSLLFSIRNSTIFILAVMNQSREPEYWHDRL